MCNRANPRLKIATFKNDHIAPVGHPLTTYKENLPSVPSQSKFIFTYVKKKPDILKCMQPKS